MKSILKHHLFLPLMIIASMFLSTIFIISCGNEEDNKCFTVKVLEIHDDSVYGKIEQVPENNVLTESGYEFEVVPGTMIEFSANDINFRLNEGDIIDISFIKYEQYKGGVLDYGPVPIIAHKVILCN